MFLCWRCCDHTFVVAGVGGKVFVGAADGRRWDVTGVTAAFLAERRRCSGEGTQFLTLFGQGALSTGNATVCA